MVTRAQKKKREVDLSNDLMAQLKGALKLDEWFLAHSDKCTVRDELAWMGAKLYVPETLRSQILQQAHDSKEAGHFGEQQKNFWINPENINILFNATRIPPNISKIPETFPSPFDQLFDNVTRNVLNGFFIFISILGLVGNGMTIYLLAYCIKRNPFTIFILNLSIADFGVLTFLITAIIFVKVFTLSHRTYVSDIFFFLLLEFIFFTYSASQFLLTAISLDRCVAVLFPLWHRCHLPPYLPTLVCGFLWILCFLLSVVHFILYQTKSSGGSHFLYQLIVNGLLCTPLMVVSTVTLGIHMRSKSQRNQRKLLTTLLLALIFFLLFSLPMDVFYVIEYFGSSNPLLMTIGIGCAAVNSSVNPLFYFLVGRKKRGKDQPRASLKLALQRVFKDEQDNSEEPKTTEEDQL
ncbi:proto-oncogene Mas-like [Pseudonaja textilis]|uniref:proto-oncogene Mas-like n=1 Tax=Pseudonaja textilis TaxID=8673 RepID=UPI000EA9A1F0|nr:proto-oncogene Mas-like [Pseudonaja textilis]